LESHALPERVFSEEAGRLTASLVGLLGDFDMAAELAADAVVEALEHWRRDDRQPSSALPNVNSVVYRFA
jgi:predicted RNA polymerase sigma factor